MSHDAHIHLAKSIEAMQQVHGSISDHAAEVRAKGEGNTAAVEDASEDVTA